MYTAYDTLDDYISIHVPREGDDGWKSPVTSPLAYFNPRPP